jgi:hypothetical protein
MQKVNRCDEMGLILTINLLFPNLTSRLTQFN